MQSGGVRRSSIVRMTGPRRLLIGALVVLLALLNVKALVGTVLIAPCFAVDMEIRPRRRAWLAGAPPYRASAFTSPPGHAAVPLPAVRPAVLWRLDRASTNARRTVAVAMMLAAAIAVCRRLEIPVVVVAAGPCLASVCRIDLRRQRPDAALRGVRLPLLPVGAAPRGPRARDVSDPAESGLLVGGGRDRRCGQGLAAASVDLCASSPTAGGDRRRARRDSLWSRRRCR